MRGGKRRKQRKDPYIDEDFDAEYERELARWMSSRRKRASTVPGFTRTTLISLTKEFCPKLRHGDEDVLNCLEKLHLLEPIDYKFDLVSPEEATDILTTDLPYVADNILSINQIGDWLNSDIKKIMKTVLETKDIPEEKSDAISLALFITETYRNGLKNLRRIVKAKILEEKAKRIKEEMPGTQAESKVEDYFKSKEITEILRLEGFRYVFEVIKHSKKDLITSTRLSVDNVLEIEHQLEKTGLKLKIEEGA